MIQRHWEISNTFEHYGPGDFGMLGWEGLYSKTLPLFHFTGLDAEQMRANLLNSLPEKLFGLVSEHPITVDTMRHMLANKTAARFSDLDETVLQLFRERELRILDPDGKVRSHSLRRLRPFRSDCISRYAVTSRIFPPAIRFRKLAVGVSNEQKCR